ncbi:uncharacterized protein BX663DRAFT_571789 [Cokeromyces recurvatus]|uniref:uncharacterized protein n=1 Tax=Cokeromyces recurvatus TaxID=90255 RepID=UPI00221FD1AA|nr:uncharacterized protein BX663DRAFT_571789 [Cokeromyces recurvatus]KAI7901737.1 hypothetical protein BX663DRAFT_571789 [Cokeromyces recurvatus]
MLDSKWLYYYLYPALDKLENLSPRRTKIGELETSILRQQKKRAKIENSSNITEEQVCDFKKKLLRDHVTVTKKAKTGNHFTAKIQEYHYKQNLEGVRGYLSSLYLFSNICKLLYN